jgi:hypothetical protein
MKSIKDPTELTHLPYRARGVVMARKKPGILVHNQPFPPVEAEDLIYRGGHTWSAMSYKTFYLGKVWTEAARVADRMNLDTALAAAMSDPQLNAIVAQYFHGGEITTAALPSAILDVPAQTLFDQGDIRTLAQQLYMSGALSGMKLTNCIFNFVLPPGAVLSDDGGPDAKKKSSHRPNPPGTPEEEEADSRVGLGGYHGSIHIAHPGGPITVYYAAAVWSQGTNGIAVEGWESWENACATLYHELNEARTDPDVDDAIVTGDLRWIGWNSQSGREIGDFPIDEAGPNLSLVFKKVNVPGAPGGEAPIQLLWSNRTHAPEAPGSAAPAVAAATAMTRIGRSAAASVAAMGPSVLLSPPGNLSDFKKPGSKPAWSEKFLSPTLDEGIARTQTYLKGLPSQFFNPAKGSPAGTPAELPIRWPGFPRRLENSDLSPEEAFRQAELISGTFVGRFVNQDEYLEWFVTRDPRTNKITRIDFTCEGPEYWEFLATHEPEVLLALYQKHISPKVKLPDLVTAKKYNPHNVWNFTMGAMHLIQPSNALSAEIFIAADATILRKNPDGSLKTDAQDLIQCAQYGVPERASDPHIGDLVNGLARQGYVISLKDPIGLYMSRPNLLGFSTPDGKAVGQEWFKITRGSEQFILRGVFRSPPGSQYVVGDVQIGGIPIDFGGQVAKVIDMGLVGVAHGKGSIQSPAFPCVATMNLAVRRGVARAHIA